MNKRILIGLVVVVVLVLAGGLIYYIQTRPFVATNNVQVRDVVYAFGDEISLVSLSGSSEEIDISLDKHYAIYVNPALLSSWKGNHSIAPGKRANLPVPDRIDIITMTLTSSDTYTVEATLVSRGVQGEFSRDITTIPVSILVTQGPDGWQITEYKELVKWGA